MSTAHPRSGSSPSRPQAPAGTLTPADLYREGLAAFRQGEISRAVAYLRAGFFENLYIAPILLGEEFEVQAIWYPGSQAEPSAARDFASRFAVDWQEVESSLRFLRHLWNDPLVRTELRGYINLCKSIRQARDERQRDELLRERSRFVSLERIKRTQLEILQRIQAADLRTPTGPPFLGLVMLSSRDPAASVVFFRKLFEVEPVKVSKVAGGYAEFQLQGIHIGIHGYDQHGHGDPYRLGPPPESLGWGAFFVIQITAFERYYENAIRAGIEIIDCDLRTRGSRFFVVKDPSGYVFEITEEALRSGLAPGG